MRKHLTCNTDATASRYWPNGRSRGVQRISHTHAAMADAIIADPTLSLQDLAVRFGYSPGWISQILASAAFQCRLASSRGQLLDPTLRATLEQQLEDLAQRSLAILRDKLDRPAAEVPAAVALRALEVATRAAGCGAGPPPAPAVQVNVAAHIEALGHNLESLLRRKRATVDGEVVGPSAELMKTRGN